MWCDIIFYVMPVYDMMCYDMLWCDMMCRVRPWCIMSCHDMLQYVMSCYVVLCHVVLCYGQSAQTFYMCLESLVGCMKENFDSFTYFRLMERFYEVSLSTFGPSTWSQKVNAFLKLFGCEFETHVEALSKQFQTFFETIST